MEKLSLETRLQGARTQDPNSYPEAYAMPMRCFCFHMEKMSGETGAYLKLFCEDIEAIGAQDCNLAQFAGMTAKQPPAKRYDIQYRAFINPFARLEEMK